MRNPQVLTRSLGRRTIGSVGRILRWTPLISVGAIVVGCGGASHSPPRVQDHSPPGRGVLFAADGIRAQIPRGWDATAFPLTSVSSPLQQLVVASFPLRQEHPDGGCQPTSAISSMPGDGALLYMFEYGG